MGQKFVLVGDIGTEHDGYAPSAVMSGSPTVIMDGKPVARQGDPLEAHKKPGHSPHPRSIAQGSSTIFVDGKPVALTSHAVDCGGVVIGSGSGEGGDIIGTGRSIFASVFGSSISASPQNTMANDRSGESGISTRATSLSSQGEEWLKGVEQLRVQPYDDQTSEQIDHWVSGATIGYGHLISQQEWPLYKDGITSEQADHLFAEDMAPFANVVNRTINEPLTAHQFDAAVMLAYNIGVGGFSSSSVAKLINDPQANTPYSSLEDAWKAWNKSQGKVSQGLINRRDAEWKIFSQGAYERW